MKIVFTILLLTLLIHCGGYGKSLDPQFAVYDHFYYFHAQLENLSKYGFDELEKYQYGKFDSKSATLSLIPTDGSWEFKKILKLKHYKDNVFEVEGYDKFHIYLDPEFLVTFIKDKDNVKSYITGGGGLGELTNLEACKQHAERVKAEIEAFPNLPQGQE